MGGLDACCGEEVVFLLLFHYVLLVRGGAVEDVWFFLELVAVDVEAVKDLETAQVDDHLFHVLLRVQVYKERDQFWKLPEDFQHALEVSERLSLRRRTCCRRG